MIALFFAIAGGSAVALQGKNSVDSGDIKKNAVKSADIAKNAVKTADIAKNAVNGAKIKNNAVGSADLTDGGVGQADLQQAEAFHIVGAFSNGGQGDCIWSAPPELAPGIPLHPVTFYKDPYGVVHLSGLVQATNGSGGDATCDGDDIEDFRIFTLPPGYRPAELSIYDPAAGPPNGLLLVGGTSDRTSASTSTTIPAGAVLSGSSAETALGLDGVTFRAAGTGSGVGRASAQPSGGDAKGILKGDLLGLG